MWNNFSQIKKYVKQSKKKIHILEYFQSWKNCLSPQNLDQRTQSTEEENK